jgi:rhamnosyltransferase
MSATSTRVLVLMATYNGHQWIEEQIESILSQNSVDIYILIRDDGSEDGTVEFLKSRYDDKVNIEIRCPEIFKRSAGSNFRALFTECDLTNFDYVALSDQDDIWQPDKISNAISALKAKGAGGYSSAVEAFWPDGKKKLIKQSQRESKNDFLYEGCGQGCTCVIRVDVFKRIVDFCKSNPKLVESLHYHDWLIYLLTRIYGYIWVFDKNSYIKYRQHNSNEIGARRGLSSIFIRLRLIKNGWLSRQVNAALNIAMKVDPLLIPEHTKLLQKYKKDNFFLRASFCLLIYRHGRRRWSDSMLLFLAALFGWVRLDIGDVKIK